MATLPLDDRVTDLPVLLGADLDGDRHLLVPTLEGSIAEDHGSGAVEIGALELGVPESIRYTDVVCHADTLADVFDDLILAILRKLSADPRDPSRTCVETLGQWRALLRPPASEPLSVNQTAGLVAELRLVIDVVSRDPARRLDFWRGPSSSRHDLRRGGRALEVKADTGQGDASVEIHGLEQLEEPKGGTLHLVWLRLERVPEGDVTVAGLVEELRRLLGGSPALYARLTEAGWRPQSASENLAFEVRERQIHAVGGGFPRLVPEMLVGGHVPSGVRNVRYEALLDHGSALTDDEVETVLTQIATAGS